MSISGISAIYVGVFIRSTIGSKGRKDHISIFELDMVIISAKEKKDNNFSDFDDDKNCKKIKISKPDKYYGE